MKTELQILAVKVRMEMLITQRESMRLHDEWCLANGRNNIHDQAGYMELSDEMLKELETVEKLLSKEESR